LACVTPVRELKEPVELRPLPSFPVIRDLVVDMTRFWKQYESIKHLFDQRRTCARNGAPAVAGRP
jgi:succinate dehydrogenase/fumarate reductase-like Fe-S protein